MGISYEGSASCNTTLNPEFGVIIAKWAWLRIGAYPRLHGSFTIGSPRYGYSMEHGAA